MNKRNHKYVDIYTVKMNPKYKNFAVGPDLLKEEKLKFVYYHDGKDQEKIVPVKYFAKFLEGPVILKEYNKYSRENEYKGQFYTVDLKHILNYEDPETKVEGTKKSHCKMKYQFYLAHVVLYAKRWYAWTDDIYDDLSKVLELDGYPGYRKTERDGIARKLKHAYDKWCEFLDTCPEYHMSHGQKYIENLMFNMYSYRKDSNYNFNDFCDVVIMTILCEFAHANNEYMNLPCPEYDENHLPNKVGLFGNFSSWYEEANNEGINGNKNLAKFFNEKVQEKWKEFE